MTDEHIEEWLTIAVQTVAYLPADILIDAAYEARQSCSHHGQIVPAIIKAGDERANGRRRSVFASSEVERGNALPEPEWHPDAAEIAEIKANVAKSLSATQ